MLSGFVFRLSLNYRQRGLLSDYLDLKEKMDRQLLVFIWKRDSPTYLSHKYMKKKRKNYLKMLKNINELVDNDFCMDMDCHNLPNSKPFTQDEAQQMSRIIGQVYSIAHGIHCTCGDKYRL
jgi:hypothetical protein